MTPQEEGWLALRLVEGIGPKTLRGLLERFGDVEAVLGATPQAISRDCGLSTALAERIGQAREAAALRREVRLVEGHGVRLVSWESEHYPPRLREIHLPPPLLYCRGVLPPPGGPVLAVVGTRRPDRYGEKITRQLIAGLARGGERVLILSGLARGIDTVAHEQALDSGLPTAAVLGGGLANIYPPENRALAERIAESGALLSEFSMGQRPLGRNFPIRNRVIAGMADAVLVVEAGERSGALITAGFAQNYARPVFAVPGNLDQPASAGANRLIQSGQARLVQGPEDLLAALRGGQRSPPAQLDWLTPAAPAPETPRAALEGEKGRILASLRAGPLHPDDLAGELEIPIQKLIGLLLELELSGDIDQTADHQYALV